MRNAYRRTWNMARKLKNLKNENCTLQDLEYGEKTENHGKGETHTLGPIIWQKTLKNTENETNTLQDLDCGEKTEKCGKCDTHTVGTRIWREF